MNLVELLQSIADAIRTKTGDTNTINAQNFPTAISEIKGTISETTLWGSNASSTGGSSSASATITGYKYVKLWVGGDAFSSASSASRPVYLEVGETGSYKITGNTYHGETGTVKLSSTTVSYSGSGNYAKINGIVGIKVI